MLGIIIDNKRNFKSDLKKICKSLSALSRISKLTTLNKGKTL